MAVEPDKLERVLKELSEGKSLRQICKPDDMPDRETIRRLEQNDAEFAAKYARARDSGLDEQAEKLEEDMALEPDVQRAKLMFEHRKWYLSKLAPKRYGEKLEVDATIQGAVHVVIGGDA